MGVGTQWRGWEGGLRFPWAALNSLPGMASALMTSFKTTRLGSMAGFDKFYEIWYYLVFRTNKIFQE